MAIDRCLCRYLVSFYAARLPIVVVIALAQTEALRLAPIGVFAPRSRTTWMIAEPELSDFTEYNIDREIDTPKLSVKTILPKSTYTQVMASLDLRPIAAKLRERYDDHFKEPRQARIERFCWDPWCVNVGEDISIQKHEDSTNDESVVDAPLELLEGEEATTRRQIQYSLKRIQANNFFSEDDFGELVDKLTQLGRSIGLVGITQPWISLYTNGDFQNFHTDSAHGPFAFVLSLCHEGNFQGGDTMLMKPRILELWKGLDCSKGLEAGGIMRYISPSPLGKCILFDPRVPHGVTQVVGTNDPRKGRLVIHGWYNQPEICWFGPWTDEALVRMTSFLDDALESIVDALGSEEFGRVMGYLACRLEINAQGYVEEVFSVCDTLQADYDDFKGIVGYDELDRPVMEDAVAGVELLVYENLKNLVFEDGAAGRSVVVPFSFV